MNDNDPTNVVQFDGVTRLPVPADRVLSAALGELSDVVVIGYTTDGNEYFASSQADGPSVLWHLERAKNKLLTVPDRMGD